MGHSSHLSAVTCNEAKSERGTKECLHHGIGSLGPGSVTSKCEVSSGMWVIRDLGQCACFQALM